LNSFILPQDNVKQPVVHLLWFFFSIEQFHTTPR